MTLRQAIIDDAAIFTSTSDFGESVVYRPATGVPRTIAATVFRQLAETISDDENRVVPVFEVHVANSCTTGISSKEINLGGDTISIAARNGLAATTRPVVQIIEQDEGMLVLQCR